MNLRQAAEMALEDICGAKLCEINSMSSRAEMLRLMDKSAEALRQALAQEQEPAAAHYKLRYNPTINAFDIAPPKKEWVGLTDEEIGWLWHNSPPNSHEYARAIEAKLKDKNT